VKTEDTLKRLRPCRGPQRGSRAGVACRAEDKQSEARHQRQFALGVGPQRQ